MTANVHLSHQSGDALGTSHCLPAESGVLFYEGNMLKYQGTPPLLHRLAFEWMGFTLNTTRRRKYSALLLKLAGIFFHEENLMCDWHFKSPVLFEASYP